MVGALTGDDSEERLENALIGAAVFGAAGAGIGAALDRQEAELRAQLGTGTVVNTGSQLVVTLPQDILFGFDSASVSIAVAGATCRRSRPRSTATRTRRST